MSRSTLLSRLLFAGIVAAAACQDSTGGSLTPTDPTSANGVVASINVLLPSYSLAAGKTMQAKAELVDSNDQVISGGTFTWSTDNSAVATVSSSGVVTGVKSGTVHVLASSSGKTGTSGTLTITGTSTGTTTTTTTTASVASVTVTLNSSALTVGQATQANAVVKDSAGNVLTGRTLTWTSSNTSVATVSSSGYVTAKGAGSASITATTGGKSGSAPLSVTASTTVPVASVTVTLSAGSVVVGGTSQATAVMKDANGNVLSGRSVSWSSSNASVASVSTSGLATGVAAGTAQIIATSEGVTGSATLSVTAPITTTTSGGSAEPTGMTAITQRSFNAVLEDGWISSGPFSIVQDASAPKSPSSVGRVTYPAGWAGGDSPALVERDLGGTATTLYTSLWVKMSSNWVGHPTGTNKIMHFWIDGINRVFAYADGAGSDVLRPYIGLQQLAGAYNDGAGQTATGVNLRPNLVDYQLTRGQWYKWEIVMTSNVNGGANGTVDWYVNGTHVGHYTGIQYVGSGRPRTWDVTKIDPTWGGLGGTVPATQTMDFDHVYISGKP